MESKKRKRILNSNNHLIYYLTNDEEFHIGLLYEDYEKSEDLLKFGIPQVFKDNNIVIPKPITSITKNNVRGKFVRKQPETKHNKIVHISYISKSGSSIEYDRTYYCYVMELLHKFNLSLEFHINSRNQKVVVSNKLIFNKELINIQKNTLAINLFLDIFGDFEIFSTDLNPAINFNKKFDLEILPTGTLNNEKFLEIIEISKRYINNENEHKAFSKRLNTLMNYSPEIRGKGKEGFSGYLVFGFDKLDIIVLETMYSGNATYVFQMKDYENSIFQNKQQALKSKNLIRRFLHFEDWENKIENYLQNLLKVD